MARKKTSKKPEAFSPDSFDGALIKNRKGLKKHDPGKSLRDTNKIIRALAQCLVEGDEEAFKEILNGHLEVVNKSKLAQNTGVPLRTIQSAISKQGNPSLKTICKIFRGLEAG